jgi:hypothetical protein
MLNCHSEGTHQYKTTTECAIEVKPTRKIMISHRALCKTPADCGLAAQSAQEVLVCTGVMTETVFGPLNSSCAPPTLCAAAVVQRSRALLKRRPTTVVQP